MSKKKPNMDALQKEYKELLPIGNSFKEALRQEVYVLLGKEEIHLGFPIQGRIKSWPSIVEKLESGIVKISKINKMQDIVGLRIVLLYQRDVIKTYDLFREKFNILRQYDTSERLGYDQFGYASIHLIIEVPKSWLEVPSFAPFEGMQAEVQIRTLAQHIWAEVSHELQYKSQEDVPPNLLRSIYRTSALLETVDLEFERLLGEREQYREVSMKSIESDTDVPLNVDNIEIILNEILPAGNRIINEPYADLHSDLANFDIKTVDKLRTLLTENLSKIFEEEQKRVKIQQKYLEEGDTGHFETGDIERVKNGIWLTHVGLVRVMLDQIFQQEYRDYIFHRAKFVVKDLEVVYK